MIARRVALLAAQHAQALADAEHTAQIAAADAGYWMQRCLAMEAELDALYRALSIRRPETTARPVTPEAGAGDEV